MFGLGMQELVIVLVIVVILFGAKRLPELASGMGKAIKNFKKATNEPDEIDVTPTNKTTTEEKKEEPVKGEK
ncbi:MAG: twin-arginine translocase TatA/TatE family subunit [Alphaproteobacteria bacterium]|uniref:Sec-independent protein translocase protein TatA n=1 Tax=Candidatus Nitrobium versatile TaxID=2884831 RepID=A0A953M058_9BACT|nr:twin-arginine translocase TatA/TatE family subunit [Candidatus Nitrobium versatile]